MRDCRVVAWAWEDVELTFTDATADKQVKKEKVKKGEFLELKNEELRSLNAHILEFRVQTNLPSLCRFIMTKASLSPQLRGRGAGKLFQTYVGKYYRGNQ